MPDEKLETRLKLPEFEERARDFLRDVEAGIGFREIYRESGHMVYGLKVGIERHAGLVFKDGYVSHAQTASRFHDKLIGHFKQRGYEPYSYELVKPRFIAAGERVGVIQDYFDGPSLSELMTYLALRKRVGQMERKLGRPLNAEEMKGIKGRFVRDGDSESRSKQLLDRNGDITLAQMTEVEREFTSDLDYLVLSLKFDNVIVLGQREAADLQRVALAIVDY